MYLQLFYIANAYNMPAFSYQSHSFRHSRFRGNDDFRGKHTP